MSSPWYVDRAVGSKNIKAAKTEFGGCQKTNKKKDTKHRVGKMREDIDAEELREGVESAFDQNILYACAKFSKNIILKETKMVSSWKRYPVSIPGMYTLCTPTPHTNTNTHSSLKN